MSLRRQRPASLQSHIRPEAARKLSICQKDSSYSTVIKSKSLQTPEILANGALTQGRVFITALPSEKRGCLGGGGQHHSWMLWENGEETASSHTVFITKQSQNTLAPCLFKNRERLLVMTSACDVIFRTDPTDRRVGWDAASGPDQGITRRLCLSLSLIIFK